jgi:hypothetical protein
MGTRQQQVTEETAVGLRLEHNFKSMDPGKPAVVPDTWVKPGDTWKVANKYANCRGMCFAASMARASKAYSDGGIADAIKLDVKSVDYNISGTILPKIPTQSLRFAGYGVGGALANNDYATLIDNKGVWGGALQKGAQLQNWHTTDVEKLYERGGHSLTFLNYTYENGVINGMDVFDNYGAIKNLDREWYESQETFMGANLKDHK